MILELFHVYTAYQSCLDINKLFFFYLRIERSVHQFEDFSLFNFLLYEGNQDQETSIVSEIYKELVLHWLH